MEKLYSYMRRSEINVDALFDEDTLVYHSQIFWGFFEDDLIRIFQRYHDYASDFGLGEDRDDKIFAKYTLLVGRLKATFPELKSDFEELKAKAMSTPGMGEKRQEGYYLQLQNQRIALHLAGTRNSDFKR